MHPQKYRQLVPAAAGWLLLSLLTLWYALTWTRYYANAIVAPFFRRGNWIVVLIYTVLTALVFKVYRCMRFGYLRQTDSVCCQIIGICIVNAITYLQISAIGRGFMAMLPMLWLTAADAGTVILWTALVSRLYIRLHPPRRLIVVYGSAQAASLVMKMSSRVDKYMICESIDCAVGMPQIAKAVSGFDGVILCDLPPSLRDALLSFCCGNHIRTYTVPEIPDILLRGGEELRLFDTPLILCRNTGLSLTQQAVKRCFDICASVLLLVLLSPLLIVCAAAVYLEDGGAILYRQQRLTKGGKVFEMLKFRSMTPDAESDGQAVLSGVLDGRVTRVGTVLRRYRLDELPQLIHVLRGEMSLVGPRPERPVLAAVYERQYPEFAYRLQVKAGLTGYAQVFGVYDTRPIDKLKMDLLYIAQYSFLLDIRILMMTLKTVLLPASSNAAQGYPVVPAAEDTGRMHTAIAKES